MKRSEIRGRIPAREAPDCAALHPGYACFVARETPGLLRLLPARVFSLTIFRECGSAAIMTWVIGGSSLLGYGVMVSDVRVSWDDDGTEADLLRKAYRVGPFLLAGFAGSVNIGFQLIDSLQGFLIPQDNSTSSAWKPEWVAEHWYPEAAQIFANASPEEQAAHSQLLIVGVSPDENLGVPEFPRVYLIKLEAPDFRPTYISKGMSVCHIGSGSDVATYEQAIAEFFDMGSPTLQAATAGRAAWAQMLGNSVGRLVQDDPREGISPHVHIQVCSLGGFHAGDNNVTRVHPGGRRIEFRMPQVASTQAEFATLCKNIGKAAARVLA